MKKNTTQAPVEVAPVEVVAVEVVAVEVVAVEVVAVETFTVPVSVPLSGAALPSVEQGDIVALVARFVRPLMNGDQLSAKYEKEAELNILLAGIANPFLIKVLATIKASKSYGSLYKARAATTDTRGTFRSPKDCKDYLAGSLVGLESEATLVTGTFSYAPAPTV